MKIVFFGAGAIGSFFGGKLSEKNNVILIGRKKHVQKINKKGLIIKGKTNLKKKIPAFENTKKIDDKTDLLVLTVKSYDTENAIKQAKKIIDKDTLVLSLQNGLDNIGKIRKHVRKKNIIAGITTQGCIFEKPSVIIHKGLGDTFLGELDNKKTDRIEQIVKLFNKAGIKTDISRNISRDIWVKAIINSSINPLTTFFKCKNGYLLENPVLEKIVERICKESTNVANALSFNFEYSDMFDKTKEVIRNTSENYSSMMQSILNNKKTEVRSINGVIKKLGEKNSIDVGLNNLLLYLIKKEEEA